MIKVLATIGKMFGYDVLCIRNYYSGMCVFIDNSVECSYHGYKDMYISGVRVCLGCWIRELDTDDLNRVAEKALMEMGKGNVEIRDNALWSQFSKGDGGEKFVYIRYEMESLGLTNK